VVYLILQKGKKSDNTPQLSFVPKVFIYAFIHVFIDGSGINYHCLNTAAATAVAAATATQQNTLFSSSAVHKGSLYHTLNSFFVLALLDSVGCLNLYRHLWSPTEHNESFKRQQNPSTLASLQDAQ
jgi:hypothetical protein